VSRQAQAEQTADVVVAGLFREHGLALVRLAVLLTGDRATAEDVVQDAFLGFQRAQPRLRDQDKALAYLRASVVNGCRSVLRRRGRVQFRRDEDDPPVSSAETAVMAEQDRLRDAYRGEADLPVQPRRRGPAVRPDPIPAAANRPELPVRPDHQRQRPDDRLHHEPLPGRQSAAELLLPPPTSAPGTPRGGMLPPTPTWTGCH